MLNLSFWCSPMLAVAALSQAADARVSEGANTPRPAFQLDQRIVTLLSQRHASHASPQPGHEAIKCNTLFETGPKESPP
jgi:hypothetical protein